MVFYTVQAEELAQEARGVGRHESHIAWNQRLEQHVLLLVQSLHHVAQVDREVEERTTFT